MSQISSAQNLAGLPSRVPSSRVLHHRVSAKFKQPPLHHFTTTLLLLFLFLSVVCFMILIRLFTAAMEHVHL